MKWPDQGMNRTVAIQHDGASAFIAENDQEFYLHAKQGVWNICLEIQPTKSTDTNVLDLLLFRVLQAKLWSLGPDTAIEGLIAKNQSHPFKFNPTNVNFKM